MPADFANATNPFGLSEDALRIAKAIFDADRQGANKELGALAVIAGLEAGDAVDAASELQDQGLVTTRAHFGALPSADATPRLASALAGLLDYEPDEDDQGVLQALVDAGRDTSLDGPELSKRLGLQPDRLTDAVGRLDLMGYVDVRRAIGTAPYGFAKASANARGRRSLR
jgi:hypothetical protein